MVHQFGRPSDPVDPALPEIRAGRPTGHGRQAHSTGRPLFRQTGWPVRIWSNQVGPDDPARRQATFMKEERTVKMSFRWYGDADPVSLQYIRQIPGVTQIVSAVYDEPVSEVWPLAKIEALKARIEAAGLHFEVVESVPVHEDIKLGKPSRDRLIVNYQQTLRHLAAAGIRVVCYNFMPVFDWTRTELSRTLEDGSTCLAFSTRRGRAHRSGPGHLAAGLGFELPARVAAGPAGRVPRDRRGTAVGQPRIFPEGDRAGGRRMRDPHGDPSRRSAAYDLRPAAHRQEPRRPGPHPEGG